jgi:hypothetical protein
MSFRDRIRRVEQLLQGDNFCPQCMRVHFAHHDEPDLRPPVCPRCGRGPADYPAGVVRRFVVHRPPEYGLEEPPESPDSAGPQPRAVPE